MHDTLLKVDSTTPELGSLLQLMQSRHDAWMSRMGYRTKMEGGPHSITSFVADVAPKYIRIVQIDAYGPQDESKSVVGFVDRRTGDVLYPKSWAGPVTKTPRGNIFDRYGCDAALSDMGTVRSLR